MRGFIVLLAGLLVVHAVESVDFSLILNNKPQKVDIGGDSDQGTDNTDDTQEGIVPPQPNQEVVSEFEEQTRGLSEVFRQIFGDDGAGLFGGGGPPRRDPFATLFGRRRSWWHGDNVCVSREETEDGNRESATANATFTTSVCQHLATDVYKCTSVVGMPGYKKTTETIYQCCHGYQRPTARSACIKAVELKPVSETLADLNLTEFVNSAQSTGILQDLDSSNITVFVPQNEAFTEMTPPDSFNSVHEEEYLEEARTSLLGHVIDGWSHSTTLSDEELVETQEGGTIRTNIYNTRSQGTIMTVNCARILSADNSATNGYIHIIDRFLQPPNESGKSMWQYLSERDQFSILLQVLRSAGLEDRLSQPGQITLFAPTNDAFQNLPEDVLQRLLNGEECVTDALATHVLPNVICTTVIQEEEAVTPDIRGKRVILSRDDDSIVVNHKARVTEPDLITSNGVIHVVDDVMLSDDARSILELANSEGNSVFLDMLDQAGLSQDIDSLRNVTIFIPTDQAFNSLLSDVSDKLDSDNEYLREVLEYHVIRPSLGLSSLYNGQQLETLADGGTINVHTVSQFPFGLNRQVSVQCSRVIRSDLHACGAISHIVDQVLTPSADSLLSLIESSSDLRTTLSLLREAELDSSILSPGSDNLFSGTVLAPSNAAWDEYFNTNPREDLSKDDIKQLLYQHLLPDAGICCNSVSEQRRSFLFGSRYLTLSGDLVEMYRDAVGEIFAGTLPRLSFGFRRPSAVRVVRGKVEQCDHTAGSRGDSILHVIDTVLVQQQPDTGLPLIPDNTDTDTSTGTGTDTGTGPASLLFSIFDTDFGLSDLFGGVGQNSNQKK